MSLTAQNYKKGFLIDDRWMGGVAQAPDNPGSFVAYVMDLETGGYAGYHLFGTLNEALDAINRIPRDWKFEPTQVCGGEKCGKENCKGEACSIFSQELSTHLIAQEQVPELHPSHVEQEQKKRKRDQLRDLA